MRQSRLIQRAPIVLTAGRCCLEAAAVLCVAGLLLFSSVPAARSLLQRAPARQSADRLQRTLEQLALAALQLEGRAALTLWRDGSYQIEPAELLGLPHMGVVERSVAVSIPREPLKLIFYPNGAASPATIQLSAGNWCCEVVVSLRGRIRTSCREE